MQHGGPEGDYPDEAVRKRMTELGGGLKQVDADYQPYRPETQNCDTCRFSRAATCHAQPPRLARVSPPQFLWPDVRPTDWCGLWESRREPHREHV